MRVKTAIFTAALLLSTPAIAIEGWGVDEQLQEPAEEQSQMPQEPEAVEEELPPAISGEVHNPEVLPPAVEPAPLTPEAVAPSPNVVDPNAEEGEVEEEAEEPKWREAKKAKLQGLNKVTARTSEIKTEIGKLTKFGNLEIKVEKCLRGPDDEKVENTALFTIYDEIPGQQRKQVFHGWMFSSSPAISALEHPIYDVILLSCEKEEKPAETKPNDKADDKGKKDEKPKDAKPADKKN